MLRVHEHQHSPEQVFVHDVSLDVVGVVFHAKSEQLQDQSQQLSCLEVVYRNKKTTYVYLHNKPRLEAVLHN